MRRSGRDSPVTMGDVVSKFGLICEKALWMCLGALSRFVLGSPDLILAREIIFLYLKIYGTMRNWYENTSGGQFRPRSGNRLWEILS